jgi:hypothetical protein
MIYNASILRIDTTFAPSPGGDPQWSQGTTLSPAIPCCQSDPTFLQRQTIEQTEMDATDIVFVEIARVPAIAAGQRLLLQLNGASPLLYIVRRARPSVMGGALDHFELFVRQQ